MEILLSNFSVLFSWFIDYSIDISIFICVIFVIKSIVSRRLPAWWHYGLWLVLMVRMLIPWKYEMSGGITELIPLPALKIHILDSMILEKNAVVAGIAKSASSSIHGLSLSMDEVLLYAWLTGMVLLGLYIIFKNIKFWVVIKQKSMLIDSDVLDLLDECKNSMKINTICGITITDAVKSPALFGYLRPRLLLPKGVLEKLTRAELAYVFMHELGHLKRHDIGISWLITILQTFHWFNPFVWLAFYQMRIDQESACDASVLSRIRHDQTKDYAGTIIGFIEKFCQNRQLPAMAGIMENKSQMKRRIAMIAKYRKSSKKITVAAIVMLLVTGFIFYTLTGFAQESQGNKIAISHEAQLALVAAQGAVEKDKDYVTARKFITDYLATNPEDVPAQVYLALGYYWYSDHTQNGEKKDNLNEAEKVFKEGYDKFPDNLNLLQYYAATLYELEDFAKAGPMMEKIYETDPKKNPRYLEAAAGAYYQAQDLVDAEWVVNKLIALPGDPKPNWINMLYSIYKQQGDQNSAIKILETYLNMPGASKKAWLKQLETDYDQQGNKEKAAEYSKLLQDMK